MASAAEVKKTDGTNKPRVNIGTIGHLGHGKTTLTAAIMKVLSDGLSKYKTYEDIGRAPQEKARGLLVSISHGEYDTANRHYAHMDYPAHADYVKALLSGAGKMDSGILVVAATEGLLPETAELLTLAKQVGVECVVVFLNKADAVDDKEMLGLTERKIRELLTDLGYDGEKTPIVVGSALCALEDRDPEIGVNAVMKLLELMDSYIPLPIRMVDKPFLLPIESATSIPGQDERVMGRLQRGTINKGDEAEFLGSHRSFKSVVTGIEMFDKLVDQAQAGDNLCVLVQGLQEDVSRGTMMCKPGSMKLYKQFEAHVYLLRRDEGGRNTPIMSNYRPKMIILTADVLVTVTLPANKPMLMPGEDTLMTLVFASPMPLEKGQRFSLKESHYTIAVGVVTLLVDE